MTHIDVFEMMHDPYPTFTALRGEDRWTWSEQMQMYMVSRYLDTVYVDENPDLFSGDIPGDLLTRAIGRSMLRLEGDEHRRTRGSADEPLKRRSIQRNWQGVLDGLAEEYLAPLRSRGAFDLVADFASPYTGACLKVVIGLPDALPDDIRRWSDSYIAGMINNTQEPDVVAAAQGAYDEAQAHVVAAIERVKREPDASVISAMVNSPLDVPMTVDEIAANVRLIITGGFNDARDAVATLPWLLHTHPEQGERALADPAIFEKAIDESVRWLSPVGSYPRMVTRDLSLPAADLKTGDVILVVSAAANHDPSVFPEPDRFNVDRDNLNMHLGFSSGAHYCLGSHLVRAMMRSAVPRILGLPALEMTTSVEFFGWQFRGPLGIPLTFESAG
jgi:cytochrome P450